MERWRGGEVERWRCMCACVHGCMQLTVPHRIQLQPPPYPTHRSASRWWCASVAAVFDFKCRKVQDLGEGHRSLARFNPHGTVLALCGFGNLRCACVCECVRVLVHVRACVVHVRVCVCRLSVQQGGQRVLVVKGLFRDVVVVWCFTDTLLFAGSVQWRG